MHPVSPYPDSLYLAWSLTRSVVADAILFLLATLCSAAFGNISEKTRAGPSPVSCIADSGYIGIQQVYITIIGNKIQPFFLP